MVDDSGFVRIDGQGRARKLMRRLWMKYAMNGVAGADAHVRLDQAYILEDPWNMECELEKARFGWTNALIRSRFGMLDSLLEVGCGEGHQTLHLQQVAQDVHGIDVSARAVARARARMPAVQFAVGDLFSQPWGNEEGRFDLVTACEVLYYLSDIEASLARMSRLGRHCLVTVFAPAVPRVWPTLRDRIADRRDWFCWGTTLWLAGWWSNE